MASKAPTNTSTRSRALLVDAIGGAELTRGEACRELQINDAEMHRVLEGHSTLSNERQMVLAALLIERVPRLASKGYALKAQALAAIAVAERHTETHSSPWK
jgi:hypothetical protein